MTLTTSQEAPPGASKAPEQTLPRVAHEIQPIVLKLGPLAELSEKQFGNLCGLNSELRIERNANGELEIMPPVYSDTGSKELDIAAQLRSWTRRDGSSVAFGPSAGFTLPNGAVRSPDASWILKFRLAGLTPDQRSGFARICPDFVIELRSNTDSPQRLQNKMDEYMENGSRLGWLIEPQNRRVYVYRTDSDVEILENPDTVAADPELDGFILELEDIWGQPF